METEAVHGNGSVESLAPDETVHASIYSRVTTDPMVTGTISGDEEPNEMASLYAMEHVCYHILLYVDGYLPMIARHIMFNRYRTFEEREGRKTQRSQLMAFSACIEPVWH
jgi:hypothetical protein